MKTMACGYERRGKLKDHLAHYQTCTHEECKAREEAWNKLVANFSASRVDHASDE